MDAGEATLFLCFSALGGCLFVVACCYTAYTILKVKELDDE